MPVEPRKRQILSSGWCRKKEEIEWKLSAVNKSKRYISPRERVFLPPLSSLIYSEEEGSTVFCVPLSASLFMCQGVGRFRCKDVMLPDQLTRMCVLFHREHPENASTSGECLPVTPDTPRNSLDFPHDPEPLPFSAPAQNCLIGIKNKFSTLTLMM